MEDNKIEVDKIFIQEGIALSIEFGRFMRARPTDPRAAISFAFVVANITRHMMIRNGNDPEAVDSLIEAYAIEIKDKVEDFLKEWI